MPESVLTLLKFCLVAVLYLFFFRVLRAVWAEVREPNAPPVPPPAPPPPPGRAAMAPPAAPRPQWAPAPSPAPPRPAAAPAAVRVVKPPQLAGRTFPVDGDELTVGRAPGCAVLLDDPTVSSIHARLTRRGEQVVLDDLGSRNGTLLNGRRLKAPTALSPGDRVGIGPNVELEVLP
jgi:pSer/pThr/pTyr-binding forkhead associated (FHA) protein